MEDAMLPRVNSLAAKNTWFNSLERRFVMRSRRACDSAKTEVSAVSIEVASGHTSVHFQYPLARSHLPAVPLSPHLHPRSLCIHNHRIVDGDFLFDKSQRLGVHRLQQFDIHLEPLVLILQTRHVHLVEFFPLASLALEAGF